MRAETKTETPKSDEPPSEKQDSLERRRLQNRLSQRNHRRKIRDRIAKLQERVIANELRAAAALHEWDQQYTPSPCLPAHHASTQGGEFKEDSPRDLSCSFMEQTSTFTPASSFSPVSWSGDWTTTQSPFLFPAELSLSSEGVSVSYLASAPMAPLLREGAASGLAHVSEDAPQDTMTTAEVPLSPDAGTGLSPPNWPLYYVATEAEAALPQLLHSLNSMAPYSNIIVLVPPECSSSTNLALPLPIYTLNGNTEVEGPPALAVMSTPSPGCPCPIHNALVCSNVYASRPWSVPGPYFPICPYRTGVAVDGCSGMML